VKVTVLLLLVSALFLPVLFAQPEADTAEDIPADSIPPDSLQADSLSADTLDIPADSTIDTDVPEPPIEEVVYEESIIPVEPQDVVEAFFQALREGDSDAAGFLISEDGLESIDLMLDILKENLDRDEEATMNRLVAAGYTATPDEIEDWNALEYFKATVVLQVMKSRYLVYQMQVGEMRQDHDELVIPLVFATSSGLELPFDARLVQEDDGYWKVTSFMGLNSFP